MNDLIHHLTGKKLAVVVAHQDDESLWTGGLLCSLPKGAVSDMISVTAPMPGRPDTETRLDAFRRVAEILGAREFCLGLPDCRADTKKGPNDYEKAYAKVLTALKGLQPEIVISHGPLGEPCGVYPNGHAMHRIVSSACYSACDELDIGLICRTELSQATWTITYEPERKKELLDCYAPKWTPAGYPAYSDEGYALA